MTSAGFAGGLTAHGRPTVVRTDPRAAVSSPDARVERPHTNRADARRPGC